MRWVPEAARHAEPVEVITLGDRKCAARSSADPTRANPCNAVARAMVDGQFLCTNHLSAAGLWVDAGVVLRWALDYIYIYEEDSE